MLRPDLFESVDLRNAARQIKCMSRQSDLEFYETDPVEKAKVPDAKVIDSLLSRRQNLFRPLPTEIEHQQRQRVAAAAAAAAASAGDREGGRRSQASAGRSRYLLVNASSELVSSFNHISMREGQQTRGKFVTVTFHVRQPNWFDQLRQVYVTAKPMLEKLLAFMPQSRDGRGGGDIAFQDFVKAERELIYSGRILRQWAYKFDVELRRDTMMRHAIDAFQCRLGLDGCDNLGYSFGLFMDECLCTAEPTPRQLLGDSTPDNYQITDRADVFVTNYFSMAPNRAFREDIIAVLYKAFVRDSMPPVQLPNLQVQNQGGSFDFGQFRDRSDADSQQQQPPQHRQMPPLSSEFAPSKANTLTLYEKKSQQQQQQQQKLAAVAASAAATASVTSNTGSSVGAGSPAVRGRCRPSGASVVRIQVPNSRRGAAAAEFANSDDDAATGINESLVSTSAATSTRLAARSQLLYVGNS